MEHKRCYLLCVSKEGAICLRGSFCKSLMVTELKLFLVLQRAQKAQFHAARAVS